jgi:hypothetical protein
LIMRIKSIMRFVLNLFIAATTLELCARIDDYVAYDAPLFGRYTIDSLYQNDGCGKRGKPNARYRKWRLNSLGFRGPELIAGCTKVICIGSSETFGLYEQEGNEFPRQLERMLNESPRSGRYQVVNVAYPGETLRTSRQHVPDIVAAVAPQYAVIYPSPANYIWLPWLKPKVGEQPKPSAFEFRIAQNVRTLIKDILPASVQNELRKREIARDSARYGTMQLLPEENIRVFRQDLVELVNALRQRGLKVLLVTHTTIFQQPLDAQEQQLLTSWRSFFPMLQEEGFLDMERRMNAAVRSVAQGLNVALCDADQIVPHGPEYFVDFSHFTDKGARAIAMAISERMRNLTGAPSLANYVGTPAGPAMRAMPVSEGGVPFANPAPGGAVPSD